MLFTICALVMCPFLPTAEITNSLKQAQHQVSTLDGLFAMFCLGQSESLVNEASSGHKII